MRLVLSILSRKDITLTDILYRAKWLQFVQDEEGIKTVLFFFFFFFFFFTFTFFFFFFTDYFLNG